MGTFFKFFRLIWIPVWLTLLSLPAHAHEWEQIFIQYELKGDEHLFKMEFDIGYAIPEIRDDPDASPPKHAWLLDQSDARYQALQGEAKTVLLSFLHFSTDAHAVQPQIHFPDWDTQPLTFPKNLNGFAYITIHLSLPLSQNPLQCDVLEHAYATNVLFEAEHFGLRTLQPGEDILFPATIAPETHSTAPVSSFFYNSKAGFLHVIPQGLDHVLFILAMCLAAGGLKRAIGFSLLFTSCHMLSFALIYLGLIQLNATASQIIEWGILGSIIALSALHLIKKQVLRHTLLILIISFGMLHGLGFARVLLENVQSQHTLSLICAIGAGVELAQLTIVLLTCSALFLVGKVSQQRSIHSSLHLVIILSALILLIARF